MNGREFQCAYLGSPLLRDLCTRSVKCHFYTQPGHPVQGVQGVCQGYTPENPLPLTLSMGSPSTGHLCNLSDTQQISCAALHHQGYVQGLWPEMPSKGGETIH